jgi:phospholipid transport system substrate-binding protein
MRKSTSAFLIAFLTGILCISGTALAATDGQPATALVESTANEVLSRLRADPGATTDNPRRLFRIAEEVVLPHFDFARMSQRVLGKHWRTANADQRARFVGEFKTLLVRTYATAVSDYRDSNISFMPARELAANTFRVRSSVNRGDGAPPLLVDYDVYQKAEAWKVFDVAINGVSIVISYRAGFNTDITKLGMDGLIDQIAQHNLQKSGG